VRVNESLINLGPALRIDMNC